MTVSRFRQRYNWAAHRVDLYSPDTTIIPPHRESVLCVRNRTRVVGYDRQDGTFITASEYSELLRQRIAPTDVTERLEMRCIFTLDMWRGPERPWMQVGSGQYLCFFRIPPVDKTFWRQNYGFETKKLYLVQIDRPRPLLDLRGLPTQRQIEPGEYLAQPYKDEEDTLNWHIHKPGFRLPTDEFAIPAQDLRVSGMTVSWWLPLPDYDDPTARRMAFR